MKNPSIFVFVFLLYCFIVSLSVFFGGAKPGRNPLGEEYIRPRKPLVTERKSRDAVLKQSKFKLASKSTVYARGKLSTGTAST